MKCSKCNADITGMECEICAGSTVAGTDAIENAIKTAHDESDNFTFIDGAKARKQLAELVERVADLDGINSALRSQNSDAIIEVRSLTERCATLEQQVKDTEESRDVWMQGSKLWEADARGDAFQHNSILRKEIEQQAKKRGYELARNYALEKSDGYTQIKPYDELSEYERDGGAV